MRYLFVIALLLVVVTTPAIAASARGDGGKYRPALMAALRALGIVPGAEVLLGDAVYRVEEMDLRCPVKGECKVSIELKFVR